MSTTAVISERSRARLCVAVVVIATALMLFAGPLSAQAGHTAGTLNCGSDRIFDVDGRGLLPAGFDAPGPWSGLFLLEGTTQVFKAFKIDDAAFQYESPAKAKFPKMLVTCTLTSSGMGFAGGPWTLYGVFMP